MNIAFKRSGAVIVGFLTVAVLSTVVDMIFHAVGVFPPVSDTTPYGTNLLLLAFAYRSAFAVLGGWVTACLSPLPDYMRDVKILAWLGTLGGLAGVVAGWNLSAHWYPIALFVTAWPLVWWGGTLHRNHKVRGPQAGSVPPMAQPPVR